MILFCFQKRSNNSSIWNRIIDYCNNTTEKQCLKL